MIKTTNPYRLLLSIIVLCFTSILNAQNLESKIKEILSEVRQNTGASSLSVVICSKDSIYFCDAIGMANSQKKINATNETLYPIGSSSKAFTAALLGVLKVDLKKQPQEYIPKLKFHNQFTNQNITISDLISHKSGLPRHDLSWYLFPSPSPDSIIKRIQYLKPFSQLRQNYKYNNYGYLLAGNIAKELTGQSWGDQIDSRLLEPLSMNFSSTSIEKSKNQLAIGYSKINRNKVMDYYDLKAMNPAGGIISNATDMGKWLQCWLNFGTIDGKEIIPVEYVQEAISSQTIMRAALPNEKFPELHFSNYGYGWMLSSYKGHYRVEHGGNINGFSTNVCFFPSDNLGIVVMTNQNNSSAPYLVRNMVSDLLLDLKRSDWVSDFLDSNSSNSLKQLEKSKEYIINKKQEYVGTYQNKGYGKIEISQKSKEHLTISFPIGSFLMQPKSHNIFEMQTDSSTKVDTETVPNLICNFSYNDSGQIAYLSINLEPNTDSIIFSKL